MIKKIYFAVPVLAIAAMLLFSPLSAYAGCGPDVETVEAEVVDNREYADLVIANVDSWVNIRDAAGTEGKVLGKLYKNSVGHYIEEENGWVKIKSGTVTGYVSEEYVIRGMEALKKAREVEITYAKINVATLRVRSKPTTESTILGTFSRGDELEVKETKDGFAKVTYQNKEGYISLDYVDIHTEFVEAESIEEEQARLKAEAEARRKAKEAAEAAARAKKAKEEAAEAAAKWTAENGSELSLGEQVVQYALQFVGNPYVYGGSSLTNGTDCSGFTKSVYAHFGVTIPRMGQRNAGYAVNSYEEALPGDIFVYSGHVAIYMGNGKIVHAASPREGICIGNAKYAKILAMRRIF